MCNKVSELHPLDPAELAELDFVDEAETEVVWTVEDALDTKEFVVVFGAIATKAPVEVVVAETVVTGGNLTTTLLDLSVTATRL